MSENYRQPDLYRKQNESVQDYRTYKFTMAEWVLYLLEGTILIAVIGYCFYDSVISMIFLSPGIILFLRFQRDRLQRSRQDNLRMQFKDAVLAVAANQKAGYSVENAFKEAYTDMRLLYGERSMICRELRHIERGLDNNVVLEKMLLSFGERSGIDDVREFGEVFAIAKRSGGNLTGVIEMTAAVIEEKTDVDQEIRVLISSKKMESNIMSVIPFLIILYMDTTSDGFFDVLYHNPIGIAIMTACLGIYLAAFMLSQKIVKIRV